MLLHRTTPFSMNATLQPPTLFPKAKPPGTVMDYDKHSPVSIPIHTNCCIKHGERQLKCILQKRARVYLQAARKSQKRDHDFVSKVRFTWIMGGGIYSMMCMLCACGCRQLFKGWTAIQIWQTRFFDVSPAFVDGCECCARGPRANAKLWGRSLMPERVRWE